MFNRTKGTASVPKVLVVDDDDRFREALIHRLTRQGMDARGTDDGIKAIIFLDRYYPDIILLDINMPGMHGIETLRQIKLKKPDIQVIMITAESSVGSGIRGMRLGAFDYLIKPVPLNELIEKIKQAAQHKRQVKS